MEINDRLEECISDLYTRLDKFCSRTYIRQFVTIVLALPSSYNKLYNEGKLQKHIEYKKMSESNNKLTLSTLTHTTNGHIDFCRT